MIFHNPRLKDLYDSIPLESHEHELLARVLKNNSEIHGKLFTPIEELCGFENIESLIKNYNNSLYYKHKYRSIQRYKNYIYISGYLDDTVKIINQIKDLSNKGVVQYQESVESWLKTENYNIDDKYKKKL